MSRHNASNENPILAVWQQQLERARANPFLLQLLLKQYQRILKRLAYFYAHLASLPRRNRRALQRALATSLIGAAMLLALSSAPVALANSITVSGACTLDEAIANANDTTTGQPYADCAAGDPTGADTIYLTADVTLAATLPDITSEITLKGNNFYVSGANTFRVFYVSPTGDFTINDTTVKDGYGLGNGGGIYNYGGTLELNNSTVSGNSASDHGGGIISYNGGLATLNYSTVSGNAAANNAGGIYNRVSTVTLNHSTVSGNTANEDGGGIANRFGTTTLNNSTVSGNEVYDDGGGIFNYGSTLYLNNSTVSGNTASSRGGGIFNISGTATLTNSTVSGNMATGVGADGGGIYNGYSTLNLNRSLVSGNTASEVDSNEIYNYSSTINADNYNLFGNSEESNADAFYDFTPGATDITATSDGTDPTALTSILDTTLALNGNPNGTLTHALVSKSPALDKAPNAACSAAPINDIDQRGFARNVDIVPPPTANDCDIGAYELQLTTAVNVTGLRAKINDAGNIALKWRTTNEMQIAGFNVWRKVENAQHVPNESEGWKMLNAQLKQAKHSGDAQGDKYAFRDKKVKDGNTYRYKIEVKYLDGSSQWTEVVRVEK